MVRFFAVAVSGAVKANGPSAKPSVLPSAAAAKAAAICASSDLPAVNSMQVPVTPSQGRAGPQAASAAAAAAGVQIPAVGKISKWSSERRAPRKH